jgi:hypothetical protein
MVLGAGYLHNFLVFKDFGSITQSPSWEYMIRSERVLLPKGMEVELQYQYHNVSHNSVHQTPEFTIEIDCGCTHVIFNLYRDAMMVEESLDMVMHDYVEIGQKRSSRGFIGDLTITDLLHDIVNHSSLPDIIIGIDPILLKDIHKFTSD